MLGQDSKKTMISLLSPAKNYEIGKAAIDCGADAVYIGAPEFSARQAAGNKIDDIKLLADYAHLFDAKVLVALNTILTDEELDRATELSWQLYEAGADALIIQDMGLLTKRLPPIRLHASTQCDNRTIDKIKWLERLGFSRAVLARELSIEQIKQIREQTSIELEAFVHGALCVSYSGQCYLSEAVCGRSANRGRCAQLCRQQWDILDQDKRLMVKGKYPLSLHDMNRSGSLRELLDAGVTTLKIEGRLKDEGYVRNITAYYRQLLDKIFAEDNCPYIKASKGNTYLNFTADPKKTFHRGSTDYFLHERTQNMANMDTPKSTGEKIGIVVKNTDGKAEIKLIDGVNLHNGDGICYKDEGFYVNKVEQHNDRALISANQHINIPEGTEIFRNYNSEFNSILNSKCSVRKIPVDIVFKETNDGFLLKIDDAQEEFKVEKVGANNADKALQNIRQQISKLGDSIYEAKNISIELSKAYFLPISVLNEWRRRVVAKIGRREHNDVVKQTNVDILNSDSYNNILNSAAKRIYLQAHAKDTKPTFELTHNKNQVLMRCKYCLLYELGQCRKRNKQAREPMYISNRKNTFRLVFNCRDCEMEIRYDV